MLITRNNKNTQAYKYEYTLVYKVHMPSKTLMIAKSLLNMHRLKLI